MYQHRLHLEETGKALIGSINSRKIFHENCKISWATDLIVFTRLSSKTSQQVWNKLALSLRNCLTEYIEKSPIKVFNSLDGETYSTLHRNYGILGKH
ncbi:hypothetical protein T01_194 [Trichinella spiralis]|uniref:Uncharacterized protein n=1 Tax=Trichinella spiralis TaxID=6334 RepID=A0A0V1AZB2_TRISP|nr:hypothetical protein T01_194 [Trichinella spiralis]